MRTARRRTKEDRLDREHARTRALLGLLLGFALLGLPGATLAQDPALGFRQRLDIRARALSRGADKPTTAVQVFTSDASVKRSRIASGWRPRPGPSRCAFAITWTSIRVGFVRRAARSEPTALVYRGRVLPEAARRERVLDAELEAAVREQGHAGLDAVDLVVLETDGSFSVVPRLEPGRLPSGVSLQGGIR